MNVGDLLSFLLRCLTAWEDSMNAVLFLYPPSVHDICCKKDPPWRYKTKVLDIKEVVKRHRMTTCGLKLKEIDWSSILTEWHVPSSTGFCRFGIL